MFVIDEMADLIPKKEAEQAIARLAQKARAVEIHVIVATQRPSTDHHGPDQGQPAHTNCLRGASKIDSRVILDQMGAEKLLGQGDMLYTPPQSSQPSGCRSPRGGPRAPGTRGPCLREGGPNFDQQLVQTATGTAPRPVNQGAESR